MDQPDYVNRGKLNVSGLEEMTANHFQRWWLVRTKGNQERMLAFDLNERKIAYFMPLVHISGVRKQPLFEMMFPGYLFLFGSVQDRYDSLRTNRIAQIAEIQDQKKTHRELMFLLSSIESGYEIVIRSKIQKGDMCRVVGGPLMGTVGRASEINRSESWVGIYVETMGQSVLLRISREHLEIVRAKDGREADNTIAA